jgi:Asp-tRNA(Asn)/Glu-tRNA(Gln) amidotransferase A subunit family amidase
MIAEAERWAEHVDRNGPLAGIPVSLKDTVMVGGFDVTVGYSSTAGKAAGKDGTLVRILKDAGQIAYHSCSNDHL